jgi:hypothetical protein
MHQPVDIIRRHSLGNGACFLFVRRRDTETNRTALATEAPKPNSAVQCEETWQTKEWTVKELAEALKQFPLDAKVYYEMGPNGLGTAGKEQYGRARSKNDELGVLLDR